MATFGYDDRGRRTAIARGNGTSTSYSYDSVSRLSQLVQNLNGTTNDLTLDFTYNPAGQIVSNTRSNNAYSFTGHANANIVDTHDGLNQLVTTGGTGVTEDARGNVTAIGGTAYAYTTEDRLRTAGTGTMAYGPEGELLSAASPSATTRFDSLLGHVIAERDGSGNRLRMFVPGPDTDEPMVWYEGNGTATRRWFHQDERGSVIAVSDSSGNLVGSINRYDEYGVPQGALTGRFGYTGQLWLPEAGMYHYRNRAYSPSLGRFMQADPIGYQGGMNLYAYVRNDPINFSDPLGLRTVCSLEVSSENGGTSQRYCWWEDDGLWLLDDPLRAVDWVMDLLGFEPIGDGIMCQQGLDASAGPDENGVDRANQAWAALASASLSNSIDIRVLAALGVKESNFRQTREIGGGAGVGVFQLTNQPGVSYDEAMDIGFSANHAAGMLRVNMAILARRIPSFTHRQLYQATLASYNMGANPDDITGNPATIDIGTEPDDRYGQNVLEIASCF